MVGFKTLTPAFLAASVSAQAAFDWTSIKPSKDLVYTPCYNSTLQCARLELPLNYNSTSDTRTVAIAISKLPAVVDSTDPTFSGSIFMNPGGPGASGVDFMPTFAKHFQSSVDVKGENHYEIVSFDPRGIAHSTPRSDCWAGDYLSKAALMLEMHGSTGLDGGDRALGFNLALEKATGKRCEMADDEDPIMGYVDTPSVCLDMIEMLDKIEALRDEKAEKRGLKNHRRSVEDVPRLQYIGFSYGTILGNYFASIHPGRVGRIILDGVCDADDYATGPASLTPISSHRHSANHPRAGRPTPSTPTRSQSSSSKAATPPVRSSAASRRPTTPPPRTSKTASTPPSPPSTRSPSPTTTPPARSSP